jgi:hypothetical protein
MGLAGRLVRDAVRSAQAEPFEDGRQAGLDLCTELGHAGPHFVADAAADIVGEAPGYRLPLARTLSEAGRRRERFASGYGDHAKPGQPYVA